MTWGFRSAETLKEAGAVNLVDSAEELYQKICEMESSEN